MENTLLQRITIDPNICHAKDLPQQNATPDVEINAISIQPRRIVITNTDFFDSFLRRLRTLQAVANNHRQHHERG